MKISVSMITLNEEANIARALSSCTFADEIVVVDGGSTDSTLDILRANDKVILIEHLWEDHFGRQRQMSLDHCTGDWVMRLDADEAFSMELEKNIKHLLSSTSADTAGYKIRQCNLVGNENYYSRIFDDYENIPRIWRNLPGLKWERHVHEVMTGLNGMVKLWDVYVVHYGFLDKKRYRQKGKYYSTLPESGFEEPDKLYYRDYDIQPRPIRSAAAPYVPKYKTVESFAVLPDIAIVTGPDLNQWGALNFKHLSDKFSITLYTNESHGIDLTHIGIPVIELSPYPDNPDFLRGLEFELFDKDIICTDYSSWGVTNQAMSAKLKFGKKVIAFEWGNTAYTNEENGAMPEIKQLHRKLVDMFVTVSRQLKESLLMEGIFEDKIVLIPEGLSTNSDKTAGTLSVLFEEIFKSTFKGAVRELAEYKQSAENDILKEIRSIYSRQIREWKGVVGEHLTQDKVIEFYRDTDSYLFDLVQYNYENAYYVQWTEDILNFCAGLKKDRGELNILDFGGGIGSQMISLSMLKNVKLNYADIPGKTFEYAKWRFSRRHTGIDMIDAGKENFLGDKMYDVVITLDVVEHLVDPEAVVRYLAGHIKPDGYLIAVTSFVDNNGEAGWHLNADRYTDEAFYSFMKSLGLEMLNSEYPRIFQKSHELVTLISEISSAAGEGRFADSRRHMESYLQLRPFDLDMLVKYADICLRLGDRETALENIERVVLLDPDMPEALKLAEKIKRKDNEITPCK